MQENNVAKLVSFVVNTLNDEERDLDIFFQSILDNGIVDLIVVDGGSTDKTVTIARKYTKNVHVVEPNICLQHLYALKQVSSQYVFAGETDHIYPPGLVQGLLSELAGSKHIGIQARLVCVYDDVFFEQGQKIFYEIHQSPGVVLDVPTAPTLWRCDKYLPIVEELSNIPSTKGFSIDTTKAQLFLAKGETVLLSNLTAYQSEHLNFLRYFKKIMAYGRGDYFFYKENSKSWTVSRRVKSLTHVFRRYVVNYPIQSLLRKDCYIAIPFFWITAFIRYFGMISQALKHGNR